MRRILSRYFDARMRSTKKGAHDPQPLAPPGRRSKLPNRAGLISLYGCLALACSIAGCGFTPDAGRADLPTTLEWRDVAGGVVAFQSGFPVPTFDTQPRLRLDLNGTWARRALKLGARFTVSSDAHSTKELDFMPYGIGTARRAWLTANDLLNTRPLDDLRKQIAKRRPVAHPARRPDW